MAYITQGPTCQIFPRKIFAGWKPIIMFTKGDYKGDQWNTDVFTKKTYEEKTLHKWEQSREVFDFLVEKHSKVGDIICDPFVGSGTTGVSCITKNRKFIGIDIEEESITTSETRLKEISNDN